MRGILSHRNIHIKAFGETPMADVELVIPAKRPQVKPFQLVNLAVTAVTALVTGAFVLVKVRRGPEGCRCGEAGRRGGKGGRGRAANNKMDNATQNKTKKTRRPPSNRTAARQQHQQAGKDISMNVIWTAASLVLTRLFQVYSQAQTQKAQLQQDMGSELYDRMNDSQEGVVRIPCMHA